MRSPNRESTPQHDGPPAGYSAWGISIAVHLVVLVLLVAVAIAEPVMRPERPPIRPVVLELPEPIEEVERDILKLEPVVVEDAVEVVVEVMVDPVVDAADPLDALATSCGPDDGPVVEMHVERSEPSAIGAGSGASAFLAIGAHGGGGGGGLYATRCRHRTIGCCGPRSRFTDELDDGTDAALRWFAWHQSPDGGWDVDGYPLNCDRGGVRCEPGTAHTGRDGDVACTGLALLCYLGAGYEHRTQSRYRKVVRAGLERLLAYQDAAGAFGARNYEQAIAAMAVAEAYGMTGDPSLRAPSQRAVDVLLARQSRRDDGSLLAWDYLGSKPERQDSSVSAWCVMALKSAKASGLDVGQGLIGAERWLVGAWSAANGGGVASGGRSRFPYTWDAQGGAITRDDRMPMGAVCAVFLGRTAGDDLLESLAAGIAAEQTPTAWPCNTYDLYYSSLAMFQLGGKHWERWDRPVRQLLLDAQRGDGCFAGSWDWQGTAFHGHDTGRLLSTALNCLTLEAHYRYAR